MTIPLTQDRLAEIRARLAQAGEWDHLPWSMDGRETHRDVYGDEFYRIEDVHHGYVARVLNIESADLIANAPADLAALLGEVERLRRALYDACGHVGYLVDDDECEYDHDGNCQAHGLGNPCGVEVARRWLATNPTGDPLTSDTEAIP